MKYKVESTVFFYLRFKFHGFKWIKTYRFTKNPTYTVFLSIQFHNGCRSNVTFWWKNNRVDASKASV